MSRHSLRWLEQNRQQQVLVRMWRSWKSYQLLVGMCPGTAATEDNPAGAQNAKREAAERPSRSPPGIHPREMKTYGHTETGV